MDIKIDEEIYQVININKKVRRTFIKISNNKEIIITSPVKLKEEEVTEIVNKHRHWINKQLQETHVINLQSDEILIFGKVMKIRNNTNLINHGYLIKDDIIYHHNGINNFISDCYQRIEDIFHDISKDFKIEVVPTLTFRKMKSKWGGCHYYTGKIVLNKVLIHLPIELIKLIINHEFTHLYVPNHSHEFYTFLASRIPNHKELKKELKKYQFLL